MIGFTCRWFPAGSPVRKHYGSSAEHPHSGSAGTIIPAPVTGTGPITINKQNGIWTVGYSVTGVGTQNPPTASLRATDFVLVWDSVAQTFVNVPLSLLTGGAVLTNTLVANNSAALQDTTSFPVGFNEYTLVFENIVPATDRGNSRITDTRAGQLSRGRLRQFHSALVTSGVDILQAATLFNAAPGYSGSITMFGNPNGTGLHQFRGVGVFNTSASAAAAGNCAGWWNTTPEAINGFQVISSVGNITSGTVKVYGIT